MTLFTFASRFSRKKLWVHNAEKKTIVGYIESEGFWVSLVCVDGGGTVLHEKYLTERAQHSLGIRIEIRYVFSILPGISERRYARENQREGIFSTFLGHHVKSDWWAWNNRPSDWTERYLIIYEYYKLVNYFIRQFEARDWMSSSNSKGEN